MADKKKPFSEVVAEKLIEQLKAGTAPWQRPWAPGEPSAYLPMNPTTGKRYKGINAIHLMAQGRSDSRWMTYKQAGAVGAQVRKGEIGTPVQYWKFSEEQAKLDSSGNPVMDATGQPVKATVMLERPRAFFATVFNGEQIDGLSAIQRQERTWDAIERAELILAASGAAIRHGENNRAFYRPATDSIHLPDHGQFPSADRYYATALHELGHWTGHESRLGRDLSHPFGSDGYAKEELRAEIASMILGDELGIGHDPGQHAAYVASWIKELQDDSLEIFRAAADAEKIQTYVLALEQRQQLTNDVQQTTTAQPDKNSPAVGITHDKEAAIMTPLDFPPPVKALALAAINRVIEPLRHGEAAAQLAKIIERGEISDRELKRDPANWRADGTVDQGTTVDMPTALASKRLFMSLDSKKGPYQYVVPGDGFHAALQAETTESPVKAGDAWFVDKDGNKATDVHGEPMIYLVSRAELQPAGYEITLYHADGASLNDRGQMALARRQQAEATARADLKYPKVQTFAAIDHAPVGSEAAWTSLCEVLAVPNTPMPVNKLFTEAARDLALQNQERLATLHTVDEVQHQLQKAREASMTWPNPSIASAASNEAKRAIGLLTQGQFRAAGAYLIDASRLEATQAPDQRHFLAALNVYNTIGLTPDQDQRPPHEMAKAEFAAFDQHSTTDLGSLVDGVHNGITPVVRYVPEARAWAIYGDNAVLADLDGAQLFSSEGEVDVFLRNAGILTYQVDVIKDKIDHAIDHAIERASDETLLSRKDAVVAGTLLDLKTGNANSKEHDRTAFDTAAHNALGFALPHDWTGEVRIVGVVDREGQTVAADLATETPQAYHLYARKGDATFGEDAFAFLTATATLEDANAMTDRLVVIDASAEISEQIRAAKLARLQEDRVRRDPNSSVEELSAAKAARLTADAAVLERLADQERDASTAQGQEIGDGVTPHMAPTEQAKTYIHVHFREKEEVKQLGARWDKSAQSWYIPPDVDPAPFAKWLATDKPAQALAPAPAIEKATDRQYLAVPFGERKAAKAAGALWDKPAQSWYVGPNPDMERLERWRLDNVPNQQGPAMAPQEEFAEVMKGAGLLVPEGHPIMDGKSHRVPVEGAKAGKLDGFYVGHLDGKPNGRVINNRSGVDVKWIGKGYALSDEEKAHLQATAATTLAGRAAELVQSQEATAQRVARQAVSLLPITEPTTYMQTKGIQPHAGALTDRDGKKTFIPAYDVDGKQWTMQYIQEDGTKRFAKDGRKNGCFHPLGGMDALAAAPALVIAEGYATAGTIADELGHATVAAFDSGNLPAVAKALHEKFPDKPVIIAGDDDRHQIITQGTNPGRTKAEDAAKAVGGTAIFPIFAPGENVYPAELPPITPQAYREHERAIQRLDAAAKDPDTVKLSDQEAAELKKALLSPEQLAGIAGMKAHTDFNDLATRSELGRDAVARQVGAAVSQALTAKEQHQEQERQQELAQKQDELHQEQKPRRAMRV